MHEDCRRRPLALLESSLLLLFIGEILLLRRAHGFGRLFPFWWDF
jgi:hypothetical protein